MKKQVALITGAIGGIGTAICQKLCSEGMQVAATYHSDHEKAKTWQQEMQQLGHEVMIYPVDVADYDSCGALVQKVESDFQQINILVNNAGITRDGQLYKMSIDQWNSVLRTNLDSIFNMTRHVLNGMISHNYGRIINISSINAQKGQFGQTNYSSAKAGMYGFTKSLAQEVARKGITVNAISPGYIDTPMVASVAEAIKEKIIAQIPVGRLGYPEEIARVVAFLADEASSFITGSNITINGGQYLQ